MYEKDFFERLNLQQLCAFLRTGGRLSPKAVEHGTLWERIRRAEDAWEAAMKAYRDKILTTDWSDLPPGGRRLCWKSSREGSWMRSAAWNPSTSRPASMPASASAGSWPPPRSQSNDLAHRPAAPKGMGGSRYVTQ